MDVRPGILAMTTLLGASVAFAGCSVTPPPSATPTAVPSPEPTPVARRFELGTRVWYGGLTIDLRAAATTFDARGGIVILEASFGNAGTDEAFLEAPFLLAAGGRSWEPRSETPIPSIPAGASAVANLRYVVDEPVDPAALAVRIGRPAEHQATVPFDAAAFSAVALVTLEPAIDDAPADLVARAGDLRIRISGLEVRYDLPDWRLELPRDRIAVIVRYDATYLGTFAGGFAFGAPNVALRLADGTTIEARLDGRSQSIELLRAGLPVADLFSRFEVPIELASRLALIVRDGTKMSVIEFALPGSLP